MKRMLTVIDTTNEWAGKLFSFLLYIGMAVLVYEVVTRYFMKAPTLWSHELAQRIFLIYYFMTGGYVLLHKGHINMDVIYNKLEPKTRAVMDLITGLFIIATAVVITWKGAEFAWKSIQVLERDNTAWNAPLYPFKIVVPIAGLLLLLQSLAELIKNIYVVLNRRSHGS